MKRSIPSSMRTSKLLPNPRGQPGRGVAVESHGRRGMVAMKIKPLPIPRLTVVHSTQSNESRPEANIHFTLTHLQTTALQTDLCTKKKNTKPVKLHFVACNMIRYVEEHRLRSTRMYFTKLHLHSRMPSVMFLVTFLTLLCCLLAYQPRL